MLVQVRYEIKSEPKKTRPTRKAHFVVEDLAAGREAFNNWLEENNMIDNVIVTAVRDASNDTVTLDVKDAKVETKGKV